MNQTIDNFYRKEGLDDYVRLYRLDHSPRIAAMIDRYNLKEGLKGKRLVDVGGGLGFAGELLDESTDYTVIDGAIIEESQKLCKGNWVKVDLDYDRFGEGRKSLYDTAFCLEVLEHCVSPYHCIEQLKNIVKQNGDIFISVPTETVTHNTPYPSLFWPPRNFAQWLNQMALPIVDFYVYQPNHRGWPAYQYHCRNAAWVEAQILFPKTESKFIGKTPQQMANL
jgi:2-polyprenyl-3-methyl-5-hydroxy-6-metoxy-1,4-benzoquinol methylase